MDESTERKRSFAQAVALFCDPEYAAAVTGSGADAKQEGLRLLYDRQVRKQLDKLMKEKRKLYTLIRAGLERIAFCRFNDAVELAFAPPDEISSGRIRRMDLSCITAVKRDKDGGVDIKLCDRQRALESLMQLSEQDAAANAESFLKALGCASDGSEDS